MQPHAGWTAARTLLRGLAVALCLASSGACHRYRPVPEAALAPDAAVRVRYDPPRAVAVRPAADPAALPRVREFRGRVVGRSGDTLDVRLHGPVRGEGGPMAVVPGTVVAIPLDTAAVQARRFSPGRTALSVVGGLAAVAAGLFVACGEYCR